MGYRFTSKAKTNRLRAKIMVILESTLDPITSREISFKVESTCNLRCSVFSVGQILRPMVDNRILEKQKIRGENRFTYQLIKI